MRRRTEAVECPGDWDPSVTGYPSAMVAYLPTVKDCFVCCRSKRDPQAGGATRETRSLRPAWFLFPVGVFLEWQIDAWQQPLAAPFPFHSLPGAAFKLSNFCSF